MSANEYSEGPPRAAVGFPWFDHRTVEQVDADCLAAARRVRDFLKTAASAHPGEGEPAHPGSTTTT